MPFIIRIRREDLDDWILKPRMNNERSRYIYEPRNFERVVASCAAPLTSFIDEDIFCEINVEKMGLASNDRTHLYLEQLTRKINGNPRRLRLKIKRVEDRGIQPPKVTLEEL